MAKGTLLTLEEKRKFLDRIEQDNKIRMQECEKEVHAVLKKYGFTMDVVIEYQSLIPKIVQVIATHPKKIIIKPDLQKK
jgi:hypothetical protein